ncbi:MAG: leucine-rich repeat protein [Salinivirgaceae bacterium]|nr:leucine-rich repeat protein [Salinivirgaceae bacterium]
MTIASKMPAGGATYYAVLAINQYTITFESNDGSAVDAITADYDAAVTASADPTRTGYTFKGWATTATATADDVVTIASKMPVGGATYYAVWAINRYTIAVTAANGTVSGTGDYEYGQTVTLTATADAHYHFVNWNGKNELTNPTISFTATKDSSLTANFAIDQFSVNFGPATDGTGTVTVKVNGNNITGGSKVNYGTEVTLTTTPESGYYFIRWSDGETGNTRTITKDTTINAVFKKEILVGDSLVYTLTSATTVSVGKGSTKPKGVLEIPATVTDADGDSFSVTKIGNYAFEDCSGLTSVTLPNGITSISFSAFRRCTGLTSVTIPESVKSLGQEAFCGTGLSSVTIPASATSIGVAAFSQCTQLAVITVAEGNTKYIDIDGVLYTIDTTELVQFPIGKTDTMYIVHNKVKTIGAYAFYYNKLKHVAIPSGVTKIGSYPFGVCYNLKSVTLPSSCTTVESNVFLSCSNLTIYCQAEDAPSNTNGAKAVKLNCKAIKIALDTTNGKGTAKILTEGGYGADGSTWIAYGEPIDLQATPKGESYELDKFTVNGEEIDNPYTVTDDATITAVFKMKSLRVTATANNAAMGTVTGGGSFEYGGNATLTATPATGHEFVRWSDGSTLNPREFSNLTADTEIEAIFAPIKYTITFVGETGETLATSEVDYGTMPEYTGSAPTKASTAQYTYTFDGWNPELAIVTGNQIYTVVFTPELRKYTVNFGPANGEGGTVTATANGSTIASGSKVDYGTELTLTAEESANGYYFFRWSDGETTTPYTLTIVKDSTIGAVYKKEFIAANGLKYTLTSKTTVSVGKGSTAPVGELDIPATVTDADGVSFSVTSMAENAFKESSELTSVTIPEGITSISENAFYGCTGLTSVTISSGVTNISKYAFYSCMALTSVDIPNSVTSIGEGTFNSCRSLTSVDIPNSVTSIGHGVFYGCSGLTSVSISNSVTSISSSMLERCPRLKSVIIPNGVTSIGSSAFYGCDSLESITIPESVTRIDKNAFEGCYGLTSVDIPKGVTIISENVFYCCRSLTSVNIPEGVTSIGNYAFGRCSKLESVSIPEGVTSIGDAAFIYCSSLTSVSIPESVTSIIKQAFQGCSKLTSVTLPSTCTTVGTNAFSDCSNLTIYCQAETAPENVPSEQAKLNCKAIKIELDTTNGKGTAKILTVGGIAADSSRWFAAGDAIELQATPKSEMYELDKYTVDGAEVTSPYTVTADATITAVFKKKSLTVNFDAKGGTGTFEPQTVEYGLTATEPSTAPTREGYTFGGWYGDEDYNYSFDFDGAITSDTTIYAKWKQNYATVGGELYFDLQSTISAISEVSEDVTIELYSAVKAGDLGNIDEPNTIIYTIAYIQSQIGVTLVVPEGANIELEGDCSGLFQGLMRLVSADLRGLNTVGVTDMNSMFFNCKKLESLDVSGFNTEKVTDMNQMFYGCEALTTLDLSGFNTGDVTDMNSMFYSCSKLTELDVSGFNTEKVTDMNHMFYDCSALTTLDLSGFNTEKVIDMSSMFGGCPALTTIYAASGADWSGVYSSDDMFTGCENLKGGNNTEWSDDYTDATYAKIDGGAGNEGYFTDINSVYGSVKGVYYNALTDLYNAIDTATGNAKVVLTGKVSASDLSGSGPNKIISAIKSSSASSISLVIPATAGIELDGDCSGLFNNCSKLVSADLRGLKTANVTNMSMMFRNCANLKTLDLSSFNTASVSNMGGMFYGCANLETLDLSGFNTEKVTDMSSMFLQCPALTTINVAPGADWYKEGVTSTDMFKYCTNLAGGSGTTFDENNIDATRARIDGGESAPGYFTCKQQSYYVNPATGNDSNTGLSAESALQSLAAALGKMNDRTTYYNIFVSGKLTGAQGLGDTLNTRAKSITLIGLNGWSDGAPQDELDGGFTTQTENGRPLTISTTVPVTVRYLALVGGYNSTNGGGLYAAENSRVTLDSSYVAGNKTKVQGAGIYLAEGSVVTMSSTVIDGNMITEKASNTAGEDAKTCGGGVYIGRSATFDMKSGSIIGNFTTDGSGGVFVRGTFNMYGGTISTNKRTNDVTHQTTSNTYICDIEIDPPGTFNMYGGTITQDENSTLTVWNGAVCLYAANYDSGTATFNMHGGSITKMKQTQNKNSSVYLQGSTNAPCVFNMYGGEITDNQAKTGGALYIDGNSTATLKGGLISGNTATTSGNGVYVNSATAKLILSDSIKFGANDDIYIYLYNSNVLLLNTLTAEAPVATIRVPSSGYSTSTQVLDLADGATTTIGAECWKFAMANTSWCVKSNGYLAEAVGVTFNLNGGTGTIASQIVVKGETAIKPATAPTRSGYAFAGWFTSAACTEAFSFAGAITKDTTLYAKWKQGVAETVDGKEYAKFSITTPEEYIALFNEIDTNYHTGDIYVSIENDLTLENVGYNLKDGFKGLIDGHGHTITLKSVKSSMYFSLFGFTNKGIIQNVKAQLDASFGDMIVTRESGAICQWFLGMLTTNGKGGILRNCWNDMSADAEVMNASGGICNKNEGLIENCINTGNLYCVINLNWGGRFGRVGGIAGDNDGGAIIRNTVNWGTVKLKTTTNWGDNILGLPGAICGGSYEGSLIENTYWRDSCIWANIDEYEDPAPTNYMIYNSSYQRGGTVTGCGHFTEDGTIIAGTAEMCGSEQTLGYGNSLLDALNSYVEGQNNPALKQWKVVDGKVVLDLEEN